MGQKSTVTEFTEKQVEILNDLLRYHPARRQWEQGIQDVGGPGGSGFPGNPTIRPAKGFGTILDEMNKSSRDFDITKVVQGTFANSSESIVTLSSGDVVKKVSITVKEEFTNPAATLSVGTDADPDEVFKVDMADLSILSTYVAVCDAVQSSSKEFKYFLNSGGSSAGSFNIVFTFGQC